jgi:predicted transcriptional regulator
MAKVTFSLDDDTVRVLRTTAERLRKPQSMVVREAVADYAARTGRLTEAERRRLLAAVDQMVARPPTRTAAAVTSEVRQLRRARRHGGRRHSAE